MGLLRANGKALFGETNNGLYQAIINYFLSSMTNVLQIISIILEAVVAVFGIMLALSKGKSYGWFIALTFAIYVFYDIANLIPLNVSIHLLYPIFFVATVSILWAVWRILREAE
jgi:hypothetical protein